MSGDAVSPLSTNGVLLLSRAAHDSVDALARGRVGHQVHLAALILAERHDWQFAVVDGPVGNDSFFFVIVAQRPNLARNVVRVKVSPHEFGKLLAPIHATPRDRLSDL